MASPVNVSAVIVPSGARMLSAETVELVFVQEEALNLSESDVMRFCPSWLLRTEPVGMKAAFLAEAMVRL